MKTKQSAKKATFKLHAPEAKSVYVAGTFNHWSINSNPLQRYKGRGENGVWKTVINLKPGAYEYRFIVNGTWQDDPLCSDKILNEFGTYNNVVRI